MNDTITDLETALDEIARLEVREQQLEAELAQMHAFLKAFYRRLDEAQDVIRACPGVRL